MGRKKKDEKPWVTAQGVAERGRQKRGMTGWSGGCSHIFSATLCHQEIIPCWVLALSSVGASVRVHRLGKQKLVRGFIWLGGRGGHCGRWRLERGTAEPLCIPSGSFHAVLESGFAGSCEDRGWMQVDGAAPLGWQQAGAQTGALLSPQPAVQ